MKLHKTHNDLKSNMKTTVAARRREANDLNSEERNCRAWF